MEVIGKTASSVRVQMGRDVSVPAGQGNTLLVGFTASHLVCSHVLPLSMGNIINMQACLCKQAVPMGGPGAGDRQTR